MQMELNLCSGTLADDPEIVIRSFEESEGNGKYF